MRIFKTRETTVRDGKERGLMKLSSIMKSQEGKMGYILIMATGRPHTGSYPHLPVTRLRLNRD